MNRVLLVEDDDELCQQIQSLLSLARLEVYACNSIAQALQDSNRRSYAAIILDWELPDGEGVKVLQEYRGQGITTPCLMLTGVSELESKVFAFTCGADDYLTKPFMPKELMLRVEALLRRGSSYVDTEIIFNNLVVNLHTREVFVDGTRVNLGSKEFALLEILSKNSDRIVPHEELLEKLWITTSIGASAEALRTLVKELRKKLQSHSSDDAPTIESVHGIGYRIVKSNNVVPELRRI